VRTPPIWILTLLAAACGPTPPTGPNLLLITVDTLRADHLGLHGDTRGLSPSLDAFARSAVVFDRCQSSTSWTLPSLASLMTGLPSSTHGCWTMVDRLEGSFFTLAEQLRNEGWSTAAVASHVFLGTDHGLHQGFVHFDDDLVHGFGPSHAAISSPDVTAKGARFLELAGGSLDAHPWFLWLHYFDPHDTYQTHPGVSEAFGTSTPAELYAGEVAFTDRHIGEVLAALESSGQAADTLVVFTADHGEEFGDHGGQSHGHTLHRELLHVPLIVRAPGTEPRRVSDVVSVMDVMPTVLELCDVAPRARLYGRSLTSLLAGGSLPPVPALAELRLEPDRPLDALVDDRWKLVVNAASEEELLYDLDADPLEAQDISAQHPEIVQRLAATLAEARKGAQEEGLHYSRGEALTLLPGETQRMGDLGYGGGDVTSEER